MKNYDIIFLLSLVTPILLFNGCSTQAERTKTLSQSKPISSPEVATEGNSESKLT